MIPLYNAGSPSELLAKALDVRGYTSVIVVSWSVLSSAAIPGGSLPANIVVYRDPEDLKRKLEKLLVEQLHC